MTSDPADTVPMHPRRRAGNTETQTCCAYPRPAGKTTPVSVLLQAAAGLGAIDRDSVGPAQTGNEQLEGAGEGDFRMEDRTGYSRR